jgi:NADH/F420H2 dehydrogenase subunit C
VTDADLVIERPREVLGERIKHAQPGADCATFVVEPDTLVELAELLRDDPELGFNRLVDVCGVDYLEQERSPRFAAVYHLHSLSLNRYVRIRVPLDEDNPTVPTVTSVWPGADYFERETYDLFGFEFVGHPNLKRILLPDDWDAHPLRKDFSPPPEPIEFSFNPEQWQKAVQRGG